MKEREFETSGDMADEAEYTDFLIVEGEIYPEDEFPSRLLRTCLRSLMRIGCMRLTGMIDSSVRSGEAINDLPVIRFSPRSLG